MKNYKKVLALLLGGVMMSSLAACGGNDTGNDSAPEKEEAEVSEEKQADEGEEEKTSQDKIDITFWHAMGDVIGEATQQLVDDFNASQDEIEVHAEYQGSYDDVITKLKASMQSGSVPDVCLVYDVGTKFMIDTGLVVPVEDMFASTGYDKSTVMDVVTGYYSVEGKQYSMPFNVSTPMLYYNKEIFKEAGLDPEVGPKTYDEVKEFAQKIVESGAAPVGYSQAIYGWFFEEQLAGLGACYGDNDNGRSGDITAVDFDKNGAGLKVLQMWKDMYDSDYFENYGAQKADTQTAFFSGQVGMIIESTANLKATVESSDFEVGTAYLPKIEENEEGGVIIGGGSLWMMDTKDDVKKEAAWKFIEYTTTPEAQAKWSLGTGYFPINEKTYDLPDYKEYLEENPNFQTAVNQLKETPVNIYTSGVLSGVQTESRQIFNDVIAKVYDGTETPEEGVADMAGRINEALENYKVATGK